MSGAGRFAIAMAIGIGALVLVGGLAVLRHPAAVMGEGRNFIVLDAALLMAYAAAGVFIYLKGRGRIDAALDVAFKFGLVLALAYIANHVLEFFAGIDSREGRLALGIGATLLAFGLLGSAGSLARQRTRSIWKGALAGVASSLIGSSVLLSFAISVNLLFEKQALRHLQEAFLASGMSDQPAFLVKNALESASEILLRMPVLAAVFSTMGSIANWIVQGCSRGTATILMLAALAGFVVGTGFLWHADSLAREFRPPFVTCGVLLASTALTFIHPLWSAIRIDGSFSGK